MRDDRLCDGGKATYDAGSGSLLPNSFQVPNLYVDQLCPLLTPAEWKVLIYATRRILGFNKRQDRISLSQFTEGTTARDGQALDHGTGQNKGTVIEAVRGLCRFGVLHVVDAGNQAQQVPPAYSLELDAGRIDFAGLTARKGEKSDRNRTRTQSAREALGDGACLSHKPGELVCRTDPDPVCGTDPALSVAQTSPCLSDRHTKPRGNPGETQTKYVPTPEPQTALPGDSYNEAQRLAGEHSDFFLGLFDYLTAKQREALHDGLEHYVRKGEVIDLPLLKAAEADARKKFPTGTISVECFLVGLKIAAQARAESQRAQGDTAGAAGAREIDLSLWGNPECEWRIKHALEAAFEAGGDEQRLREIARECKRELQALNWPMPVITKWWESAARGAETRVRWSQGDRRLSGSCA